jgi:ketosteroid isomerase-like protein
MSDTALKGDVTIQSIGGIMGTSEEVLDLVRRWAGAEQGNDAEALEALLAADFVGVGPLGFVLTRDQWLRRFQDGLKNQAFAVEQPQVHDHGGAAVLVGVQAQQTSWQGRDNSGRFRITLTAVRLGEGWRLASVHIGPLTIPPGPGEPQHRPAEG